MIIKVRNWQTGNFLRNSFLLKIIFSLTFIFVFSQAISSLAGLKQNYKFPSRIIQRELNKIYVKMNIDIEYPNSNYAAFIPVHKPQTSDTTSSKLTKNSKSDLFYYLLGIAILIAAGYIFKKRYEDYLKERNRRNK